MNGELAVKRRIAAKIAVMDRRSAVNTMRMVIACGLDDCRELYQRAAPGNEIQSVPDHMAAAWTRPASRYRWWEHGDHIMTVEIVVYLSANTKAKEFFIYLDDELGRKEYDALASAFRALDSSQTEKGFYKLTLEAAGEWLVRLDALQAIELRNHDECGIQHQIAVETDHAKRRNRIDKAVKEASSEGVGFR
jgi:hypothetical protein